MTRRGANAWIGLLTGVLLAGPLVLAQQPLDAGLPADAVAFFDRTTATGCPSGWTEFTGARGAYITGLTNGGTKATLVGSALTNQEDRTHTHDLASHTHPITHDHPFSATTGGPSGTTDRDNQDTLAEVATGTHTHTFSGTTGGSSSANSGGPSAANTGTQSTTIVPYLQYLLCRKT